MDLDISVMPFSKLMGVELTSAAKDRVEGRLLVLVTQTQMVLAAR